MRVKFERRKIEEAHSTGEAYDGLGRVLAGSLPVLVTRRAREIGYDIRSERGLAVVSLRGMSVERPTVRRMGLDRRHEPLRLHTDGFVDLGRLVVHDHETLELPEDATAQCTLVQAKRNLSSPVSYGYNSTSWSDYLDMEKGELDPEMLHPIVYQAELNQGDVVDFCASGPVTMVHLFSADPPYSDRTVTVSRIL